LKPDKKRNNQYHYAANRDIIECYSIAHEEDTALIKKRIPEEQKEKLREERNQERMETGESHIR